ncbi:MAG: hypothetical protein AAGA80_24705 [Cyanobacteria bacterium P01_F01_bin.143]
MYLPPLQSIANSEIQICGDVEIHPTASIAPGVILKAASNSRIVIGADVCVGMGVILSSCNGSIEIEAGVTLGSGVLIIGSSKIGANSCIGTTTTIFNASIASMTVINPGSIIGDNSRSGAETQNEPTSSPNIDQEIPPQTSSDTKTEVSSTDKEATKQNQPEIVNETVAINSEITDIESNSNEKESAQENNSLSEQEVVNISNSVADVDPWQQEEMTNQEYQIEVEENDQNSQKSPELAIGKVYIDQLLVTLFPHKNSLNKNPQNHSK